MKYVAIHISKLKQIVEIKVASVGRVLFESLRILRYTLSPTPPAHRIYLA